MKTDDIKISPDWSKSKDEIWADAFEGLEDTPNSSTQSLYRQESIGNKRIKKRDNIKPVRTLAFSQRPAWFYAAASIAAIAVILSSIAFFYTKSEVAERGSHLAVVLPDGSKADLNADSKISYKPFWWYITREVKLKGEAYFEVEKGSRFDVRSGQYTISVLGTSFNVFSRAGKFNVTCLTGKVNVSNPSESVILTPNMQVSWDNGKLTAKNIDDARESINWKQGKFVFISVPLQEVIQEIERQYNIKVSPNPNPEHLYSGNFTKTEDPNEVLKIVGKPFKIEFKIK